MPSASRRPIITFLTDFGPDGAAATCRGVMLGICPDAQIVDISHSVRKFAIGDGAMLLRASLPYMPQGVHVGVVDPGVGTERRPIGILTDRGDVLIGPDNGLLILAADALGGTVAARELTNRDLWLPTTTSTFHGRDIFSPMAAHLAAGSATFDSIGDELDPTTLARLERTPAQAIDSVLEAEVAYVDSFGNLRLAAGPADLKAALGEVAERTRVLVTVDDHAPITVTYVRSFGHVARGEPLLYVDSTGDLALAENQGSLADRIGAQVGMRVRIERGA
ncbi:MAG: SAM hydrolase/SAM-dependent halogenase family protein [Candidatus Limnocylindria bacterium]